MRFLLFTFVTLFLAGALNAETLKYEPNIVSITGTLISGKGLTPDEKAVIFPAIKLDGPIRVEANTDDELNETEDNVTIIQLILNRKQLKEFNRMPAQKVFITGKLSHAITGHHYTKVLLKVENMEKQ